MALKLIGAVGVKVRPEAENFRDEAERQIRRQYGNGRDGEHVDVRVQPKLDEQRMRRDFERHRESMRRTMQTMMDGIEVQPPRISNSRFAKDAAKIRADNKKLYEGLAADRRKFQRDEAKGWGSLLREHAKYEETVASSTSGFKGRQKILAQMAEMAKATAEIGRATSEAADAQERWDRAAGVNIAKYVLNLNKARQELGRVRDQQENIDKANFRGTNNALKRMRGELEKTATIFDDVARQVREFGQSGATKKMRIDVDTMKAWKDTQRFLHMWKQIPEQERRTLAVRIQMDDNRAIEKFQEFKRGLDDLDSLQLRDKLRGLAEGTREYAIAQEALNERLREARRVNSGWAGNHLLQEQLKDNARLTREVELAERARQMTASELGRAMRGVAKDSREYAIALDEVNDRLRTLRRRREEGWLFNTPEGNERLQRNDNDRIMREFRENQRRMREEAERTRDHIDKMEADIKVDLDGTKTAAATMKWLTRPRTIPLHVRVSGTSLALAEGILQSITGMNALQKLGQGFEKILTQYDKFTVLAGLITAAVGSLVNVVVGGVASIFSIGQGLAHVLQGAAMAPTLFGAIGTSVLVATVALKDFFSALSSGDFSNLTGNALKNAQMLEGTWTKLADAIRDNFWEEAGTSMGKFVTKALPTLTRGLSDTASEMGRLWDGVWRSMTRSLDLGYLDTMFDGLSGFMGELAGAAEPAMNAIMQLGMRGAEHLPRLGEWMREGAEGFEQFIAEADEAGKIDQWIENSAAAIQDLGLVAKGAGKMMEGLSRAALEAGGPSLNSFAEAMDRWGDAVQSMRGQEITGLLFEGALEGLSRLGDGMGNFFSTLGDHMGWLRDVMSQSGGIGGALFDSLATIFDNDKFRSGTLQGLMDIEEAARDLEPAFDSAAGVIGTMARVSGAVLKGIAPTINEVVGMVGGMVETLADPIIDLIPRLTSSVGALVGLIEPGVRGATSAVAGLVDGFNGLPDPIQTALLTMGGLVALRPHLSSLADAVGQQILPAYTRWGQGARALQEEHRKQGRNISLMTSGYRYFKEEMVSSGKMARQAVGQISRELGGVNDELRKYRVVGGRAFGTINGHVVDQTNRYNRLVSQQRELTNEMRSTERATTRMGMGFATFDRYANTSLYGAYEGALRAGDGFRRLGGAVRDAARPTRTFTDRVDGMATRTQTAFARMYTSVADFGARADRVLAGGQFGQLGRSAEREQRAFSSAFGRMGQSVRDFDTRMRTIAGGQMFGGFNRQIAGLSDAGRQARDGLSQIARGAGDATRAIGATAASGLRAAAGGLMGAMGGPWGVALAGAAVGIGLWAQKSAEAKASFEEFKSTLNPATGAMTNLTREYAANNAALEQNLGWQGLWQGSGQNAYDLAQKMGVSQDTMTKAYQGNSEAVAEVTSAIDEYQRVNMSSEGVERSHAIAMRGVREEVEGAEEDFKEAQKQIQATADALGVTTDRAMVMDGAWQEFGATVRSGTVDGQQMVAMMDQLTGGTLSAQDAAYNYQSSLAAGKDALKEWAAAHGDSMSSINKHFADGNKTLDMTKQSHRDLYAILRQQVEPAFQQVADVFNSYGGGEAGIQAARDTMAGIRDDMFTHLTEIEGMGADTANALLDSLNIKPDAVEMILEKSAAEQSLEEISNSLKLLTGEAQVAKVTVEREGFDPLKTDAQNAKEQLAALTSPTYRAMLEAEDRMSPVIDDVTSAASQLAIKDWIVMIAAQDDATGTVNAVRQALEGGFNNQSYEAVLTVLDNASGVAQSAKDNIMSGFVQGDYEAMMTAVDNAGPEAEEVKGKLEAIFNGDPYQAFLEADGSSASEETRAVADAIGDIDNKTAVVTVTNTGADSLERQLARIDGFQDKTVTVTVTNTGADSLNRMRDRIDGLTDKTVTVTVTNTGAESLNRMQARLDNLQSKSVHVTVTNSGAESLDRMNGRLNSLQSKSVHVTVTNSGADSLVRLKGRIDAIKSKSAKVTVTNSGADSLVRLKGRMDAIRSKSAKVTVTNSGQDSLVRMKQKIDAIRSKSEKITVTNSGQDSLVRLRQRIAAIRSKSAHVSVSSSGHGGLYSLRAAINAVRGKTVYVNVHTRRTGSAFANGGVVGGDGVQYFADGGFSQMGKILDRRMRFAWENHTAQIAHAGANRLWAEPETGGEAYIPMSASKRTRSEDILGEVANRFGGEFINSRGQSSRGGTAVATQGDTYNITLPVQERGAADEVAEDLTFHLSHMRRGGYDGGFI